MIENAMGEMDFPDKLQEGQARHFKDPEGGIS